MNLNKKITKFTADGIPAYNAKINELIEVANWLLGVRTINGKVITESDQGPVIDLSQVNTTQGGPVSGNWQTDPNGNKAGWFQVTVFDSNYATNGKSDVCWIWSGGALSQSPIPWMIDPSGLSANWVVCSNNTFWGTGNCPAGVGNYQTVHFVFNGPTGANPAIYTGNAASPPIAPPKSPPAFYLVTDPPPVSAGLANQPCLHITVGIQSTDPAISVNFTWTITYDGNTVFSVSGSGTAADFNHPGVYFLLDPTNWLYDPGGLPGYSHGNKQWIWQYNGTISANTNPAIVQTFSYSCSRLCTVSNWTATLLTA